MNADKIRDALKRLSPREGEVMNHVVSGLLNKEVAAELGITERTVKQHRARVMAKLGAKSFAELITMVLTIQFNGKHEEANMQSMMSLENADALKIMADVLQTSSESFLKHLVFWHCQRQIETRGIEYFAETIHAWLFPSRAAAQRAADKFEELAEADNLESNIGGEFLYGRRRSLQMLTFDKRDPQKMAEKWPSPPEESFAVYSVST